MNFQLEIGDRVRVVNATANPFWHWTGVVEETHALDGQPFYRVKTGGMHLLFHETWLSKIVMVLLLLCVSASAQQPSSDQPRASYLTFEGVAIRDGGFSYRPSVGFRASAHFSLSKGFYLREEIETAVEFKTAPPVSGEGRYFASRTSIEKDVGSESGVTFSAIAGLSVSQFANPFFNKTVVRAQVGIVGRLVDSQSRMPRLEISAEAVMPLNDPNRVWGAKARANGFYNLPHRAYGVTGGVDLLLANVKGTFSTRRSWSGVWDAHAGVFVNLSAIKGY